MRIVLRLRSASAIPKAAPVAHPIDPHNICMCTCTSSGSVIGGSPKLELPLSRTTLSPGWINAAYREYSASIVIFVDDFPFNGRAASRDHLNRGAYAFTFTIP